MLRHLLVLVFVSFVLGNDPCVFEPVLSNGASITTPSDTLQCFQNIPFSDDARDETISVLQQLISLYSFTDIAVDSGSPYNMKVNLSSGLLEFSENNYTRDWDFQSDLIQLFNALNDGHTLYYAPAGYQKFITVRPFVFTSLVDNSNNQIIVTLSSSLSYWSSWTDIDLTPYIGKQVLTINGVDVLEYMIQFSETVGTYKDLPNRFNSALQNSFTYMSHAYLPVPTNDTEIYTFAGVTDAVELPLLTIVVGASNSTEEIIEENEYQPQLESRSTNAPQKPHFMGQGPQAILKDTLGFLMQDKEENKQVAKNTMKTLTNSDGDDLQVLAVTETGDTWYGIWNKTTAVIKMTTFAPSVVNTTKYPNPWDNFRQVLEFGLNDANSKGIKNMVLDVMGNGGGYICLSYATLRFFAKSWENPSVYQPYDFRESPTTDQLVMVNEINSQERFQVGTEETFCNLDWYTNSVEKIRGGESSLYTEFWAFACPLESEPYEDSFWLDNSKQIFMDKIIVLTDGTCGSACNYFASKMTLEQKAYTVSVGGIVGQPQDIASFAGGNVLDWEPWVTYINAYLDHYNVDIKNRPQQLPTSAPTRYNFAEVYFGNDSIPREFERVEADKHLNNWFFDFPEEIYPDVQPLFANFPGGWPSETNTTTTTGPTTGEPVSTTGDNHNDKSDAGKIAGIVIGVFVGAGVVAGAIVYVVRKRKYAGYKNIA